MLAARFYGVEDIRVEEIPEPDYGSKQVLVKIIYAGVCGSDLHIFKKGMFMDSIPETMGHEFIGIVEELGVDVSTLSRGEHVIGDPRVSCGMCKMCVEGKYNLCPEIGFIGEVSPGCFTHYIVMDENKLHKVPSSVNLKEAALIEPLAVAVNIARKGKFSETDSLGIIGAGPIGLLTLVLAKSVYNIGKVTISDICNSRLNLAASLGADKLLPDLDKAPEASVDTVVEVAGNEATFNAALNWLVPEGTMVIGAVYEDEINIDPNILVCKEIHSSGAHAYSTADLQKGIDLLAEEKVNISSVISQILPLDSINKAFQELTAEGNKPAKILLDIGKNNTRGETDENFKRC